MWKKNGRRRKRSSIFHIRAKYVFEKRFMAKHLTMFGLFLTHSQSVRTKKEGEKGGKRRKKSCLFRFTNVWTRINCGSTNRSRIAPFTSRLSSESDQTGAGRLNTTAAMRAVKFLRQRTSSFRPHAEKQNYLKRNTFKCQMLELNYVHYHRTIFHRTHRSNCTVCFSAFE